MRTTKTQIFLLFCDNLTVVERTAEAIADGCQPAVATLMGCLYIENVGLDGSAEKIKRSRKFQKTVQNQLIDSNRLPWKTDVLVLANFCRHPHAIFPVRIVRPVLMGVLM